MTIGKFETTELLGSGNFGTVYKAIDTYLDAVRAIKIINVANAQSFVNAFNEAQILERCKHNHIVEIKEINIIEITNVPYPCIITEYLEKGSVQSYLERKFVTVQKACAVVADILFGLEHAHNQKILHRDIKPGNILLSNNNRGKLSDFGLAYGLSSQSFNFAGYNAHLAIEVLENIDQDEISDMYSTGVTFYRLLNNLTSLPIPFQNKTEYIKAVRRERFPQRTFSRHIPNQIKRLVTKSLKADRNSRFQNCLEFRQAIQKIPLSIAWKPLAKNYWAGLFNGDNYEIVLYDKKKLGFFIDFTRNARKISAHCCEKIPTHEIAEEEFYNTIRETTLNF